MEEQGGPSQALQSIAPAVENSGVEEAASGVRLSNSTMADIVAKVLSGEVSCILYV